MRVFSPTTGDLPKQGRLGTAPDEDPRQVLRLQRTCEWAPSPRWEEPRSRRVEVGEAGKERWQEQAEALLRQPLRYQGQKTGFQNLGTKQWNLRKTVQILLISSDYKVGVKDCLAPNLEGSWC